MNQIASNRQYYPALDGLRGLAILLVVFLHNFGFMDYFFFGWLGVDLFFVLSGFLITDILLRDLNKPRFLQNFYIRRIIRIFPVYYLTLIVCLLAIPNIKNLNLDVNYYTTNQVWLWTYLQNWLYVIKPPYGDKILLHTWSLAVEEQFYIAWPFIVLLLRKKEILLIVAFTILLAVGLTRYIIWINQIENLAYASLYTFTRIDGLCIGCIVALLFHINPSLMSKYRPAIVLMMAGLNFGFYSINNRQEFTLPYLAVVGYTTFAVLFGILIHEAVMGKTRIIQILFTNRFMKFFGKISYGLYVYHWPIYIYLYPFFKKLALTRNLTSPYGAQIGSAVFVTIITIALSFFSYRYFEKQFLKLKPKA